jgi:hypothetical protein
VIIPTSHSIEKRLNDSGVDMPDYAKPVLAARFLRAHRTVNR